MIYLISQASHTAHNTVKVGREARQRMDKPLRRSAVLALTIPLIFPFAALLLDRLSGGAAIRADGSNEASSGGGSSRALLSASAVSSFQRALASLLPTALLLPLFAPFIFALAVRLRLPRAVLGSEARSRTISTTTATDAVRRRGLLAGSAAPHGVAARGEADCSRDGGGASGVGLRSRRGCRHQRGQTEPSLDAKQQSYGTGMQAHSGGRCRASSSVMPSNSLRKPYSPRMRSSSRKRAST